MRVLRNADMMHNNYTKVHLRNDYHWAKISLNLPLILSKPRRSKEPKKLLLES